MRQKIINIIHKVFEVFISLKALNGVFEIIGGVLVLLFGRAATQLTIYLTQNELSTDPSDLMAQLMFKTAHDFSISTRHFVGFYLLIHGSINIFLVVSLWRNKHWAYPVAIIFFLIFIFYQVHRFYYTHSIGLLFVSFIDILVIILTWLDYKRFKSKSVVVEPLN